MELEEVSENAASTPEASKKELLIQKKTASQGGFLVRKAAIRLCTEIRVKHFVNGIEVQKKELCRFAINNPTIQRLIAEANNKIRSKN